MSDFPDVGLHVLTDVREKVVVGVQVRNDLIAVVEVVGAVMVDVVNRRLEEGREKEGKTSHNYHLQMYLTNLGYIIQYLLRHAESLWYLALRTGSDDVLLSPHLFGFVFVTTLSNPLPLKQ